MAAGHAVVVGGSIAGMCAAQALRGRFGMVTILEQDRLSIGSVSRRGTPQAWHNHFLLDVGREAIEALFPGFTSRLLDHGGMEMDPGYYGATCFVSGWMPRARSSMSALFASRTLIEATIRELLLEDPGVEFRENARMLGLLSEGSGSDTVVTGVQWRDLETGTRHDVAADFVVDATGRGSRSASWLRDQGSDVAELTLDAQVSYSSRIYRLPDEPIAWWKWLTVLPEDDLKAPEPRQYVCIIFPIEGNRIIAMMGSWGLATPSDTESFERFARDTRSKEFYRVLDACEPLTDVHHTRSTRNVWRRFDRVASPPQRFIAVGDAACAFNPIYGQGMSTAAVGGVILRRQAEDTDPRSPDFPANYYAEQARFLQRPWVMALTRDRGFTHARGSEAMRAGPYQELLRRINWPAFQFFAEAIWQDHVIDHHFNRLLNVRESLSEFLTNPRVLGGLGRYGVKKLLRRTIVPAPVPAHLPPPDTDYSTLRDVVPIGKAGTIG